MEAEKLNISLPKDMAQMVRRQVETGAYASDSDVIRDALRLWQNREQQRPERLQSIRARLNEAAEDPESITDEELGRHFDERLAQAEKKRGQ